MVNEFGGRLYLSEKKIIYFGLNLTKFSNLHINSDFLKPHSSIIVNYKTVLNIYEEPCFNCTVLFGVAISICLYKFRTGSTEIGRPLCLQDAHHSHQKVRLSMPPLNFFSVLLLFQITLREYSYLY